MRKRVLALVLTMCMVLSLLPSTALAAEGVLTVSGGTLNTDYTYNDNTGEIQVKDGAALTISGTTKKDHIVIAKNAAATITLSNVNVELEAFSPIALDEGSKLTLILEGTSTLVGRDVSSGERDLAYPAIHVPATTELIIQGSGALNAHAYTWGTNDQPSNEPGACAAIGSKSTANSTDDSVARRDAGTITLAGSGTITATASEGIGGEGAKVSIQSGTVNVGANWSYGIGGKSSTVSITGGAVRVLPNEGDRLGIPRGHRRRRGGGDHLRRPDHRHRRGRQQQHRGCRHRRQGRHRQNL